MPGRFAPTTLTILLSLSVLTACKRKGAEEEGAKRGSGPSCGSITPKGFPSPAVPNAVTIPRTACMTAAECVPAGTDTGRLKIGQKYCDGYNDAVTNCDPGNGSCPINQLCKPEYLDGSSGVTLANCAVAAGGNCAAGEVNCKCDVTIAANRQIVCGCRCRQ